MLTQVHADQSKWLLLLTDACHCVGGPESFEDKLFVYIYILIFFISILVGKASNCLTTIV